MRALTIAALLTLAPMGAHAVGPIDEIRAGAAVQGLGPFSPNKEDGAAINGEILFDDIDGLAFLGKPRPQLGISVATAEFATSRVYAGLNWGVDITPLFFVDGGVGLAVHDGETSFNPTDPLINERNYLGCRVLAHLSASVGMNIAPRVTASVYSDHMSNGGICSENEGLDSSGFRLGVKF